MRDRERERVWKRTFVWQSISSGSSSSLASPLSSIKASRAAMFCNLIRSDTPSGRAWISLSQLTYLVWTRPTAGLLYESLRTAAVHRREPGKRSSLLPSHRSFARFIFYQFGVSLAELFRTPPVNKIPY
ncbi:hypothetical protein EJ06DRAFT_146713 [Trichodelitschia bisporula]|uniref:Uncharacterized protein n=1 Tax=Trichodelitschia bisporula TaxID=703511 RepID=A0A6G1HNE9_9PEZI|nr:hypothetical protein EJ06DRAFT_146713 [Trichodelitschia bisporula]